MTDIKRIKYVRNHETEALKPVEETISLEELWDKIDRLESIVRKHEEITQFYYETVDSKYKRFNSDEQGLFFKTDKFKSSPEIGRIKELYMPKDPDTYTKAKERMANYLKKSRQENEAASSKQSASQDSFQDLTCLSSGQLEP